MRKVLSRAERRQRDDRLDAVDRDIANVIDRHTLLTYGDGRVSVNWLAEQVHRCARTVRYHMARLERFGYLEIRERVSLNGGPAVNCYRIRMPRERSAAANARRAAARAERDRLRKEPRRARFARCRAERGGGVLQPTTPALTCGRVNAPSGAGEVYGRPPVPVGQAAKTTDQRQVVTMDERFDELGPTWGTPVREVAATPGQGWPGTVAFDWEPDLTDEQIDAALVRGSPIRLTDVAEARRRGRLSASDAALSDAEVSRYNARAALTWEVEQAGRPAPRPRPRWRR